jgi:hypothetical protein
MSWPKNHPAHQIGSILTEFKREMLDDYIAEDNAVRVIDVFIDELDLSGLGFHAVPQALGRPGYAPTTMLKLSVYGSEPYSSKPMPGTRVRAQPRADVVNGSIGSGLQDDCGFSQRQRRIPLEYY